MLRGWFVSWLILFVCVCVSLINHCNISILRAGYVSYTSCYCPLLPAWRDHSLGGIQGPSHLAPPLLLCFLTGWTPSYVCTLNRAPLLLGTPFMNFLAVLIPLHSLALGSSWNIPHHSGSVPPVCSHAPWLPPLMNLPHSMLQSSLWP